MWHNFCEKIFNVEHNQQNLTYNIQRAISSNSSLIIKQCNFFAGFSNIDGIR